MAFAYIQVVLPGSREQYALFWTTQYLAVKYSGSVCLLDVVSSY